LFGAHPPLIAIAKLISARFQLLIGLLRIHILSPGPALTCFGTCLTYITSHQTLCRLMQRSAILRQAIQDLGEGI
jgi:hypothetical protein